MSDEKLLRLYLNTINGKLRFISGGLVSIEYSEKNNCDIYDSYTDLII